MPSPRRALLLVPAAIAVLAVAGCSLADDGTPTTQTRHVAGFTRVDNPDSVDVRLRAGTPQRVQVRAGDKVIGDVHTEVRDGTLRVTFDHHGFGGGGVIVDAVVPRLTGIAASGSGDVDAAGIRAAALDVRSDGSGDVAVQGTVGRLVLDLQGSGDGDLADLTAREARVTAGGSGDATVRAAERLTVELDGSGDVRYAGSPTVTEHDDGSGEISRGR
jgi:hypothetical protein